MKIKAKVLLSTGIVFLFMVGVATVFFLSYQNIHQRLRQSQDVALLIQQLFVLNQTLNDYSYYPGSRARSQWEREYRDVGGLIVQLGESGVFSAQYLGSLQDMHAQLASLFAQIERAQREDDRLTANQITRQIYVQIQDMVLFGNLLIAQTQEQLTRSQGIVNAVIVAAILGVTAIIVVVFFMANRTIVRPVVALQRGAQLVGSGNFDHRVEIVSHDEIGDLARVFNEMTLNLKNLTAVRDEFLSMAAHELKTPLAVIKTHIQLLQEGTPEERMKWLDESAEILNLQCSKMNKLIQDLLETSRLHLRRLEMHKALLALNEVVENSVFSFRRLAPKYQFEIERNDAVEINADRDRFEQVLFNLLDNAVKYSPRGGKIEVQSVREDRSVKLSVKDHGIGIPQSQQAQIFEKFFSAHKGTSYEHASSMGVGLYLAKEFVERHGGRIWFESREGEGSTFFIRLPLPMGDVGGVQ